MGVTGGGDGRFRRVRVADVAMDGDAADVGGESAAEGANKLYVGMLIMLIFSEALAL